MQAHGLAGQVLDRTLALPLHDPVDLVGGVHEIAILQGVTRDRLIPLIQDFHTQFAASRDGIRWERFGRRPFVGPTNADISSAVLTTTPPAVTQIKPDLPRHLGAASLPPVSFRADPPPAGTTKTTGLKST